MQPLPLRPSKRYIVFEVPDTLGLGPEVWRVLSKCHDMRNRTEYERVLDVDDPLASALISACRKVAENGRWWWISVPSQSHRPHLKGPNDQSPVAPHGPDVVAEAQAFDIHEANLEVDEPDRTTPLEEFARR